MDYSQHFCIQKKNFWIRIQTEKKMFTFILNARGLETVVVIYFK